MRRILPTLDQQSRLRAAIAEARSTPPQQEQRLTVVENAIQVTGDGFPDEAVESMIDMIMGREPQRPGRALVEELFGHLPDDLFEGLGQLVAIKALSDRLLPQVDNPPLERLARQLDRLVDDYVDHALIRYQTGEYAEIPPSQDVDDLSMDDVVQGAAQVVLQLRQLAAES